MLLAGYHISSSKESQGRKGCSQPSFSKEITKVRQCSYKSVINVIKSLLGNDYALNLEVTSLQGFAKGKSSPLHCLTHPDSTSCETSRQSALFHVASLRQALIFNLASSDASCRGPVFLHPILDSTQVQLCGHVTHTVAQGPTLRSTPCWV